jgi:hypothetical protein
MHVTSVNGRFQLPEASGHFSMHLALTSNFLRKRITVGAKRLTYLQSKARIASQK